MEEQAIKVKKHRSYSKQKLIWAIIFLTPWLIGLIGIFLIPMFTSFRHSFFHLQANVDGGMNYTFVGITNYYNALYTEAIGNTVFQVEMLTTIQDVAINIPVIMVFSLFIAVILNAEFRGRALVRAIFFIPVILNSAAVVSAMSSGDAISDILTGGGQGFGNVFELEEYLIRAGLSTGLVGFIVSLIGRIYSILALSGVPILLFLASIQSIPKHLYEAAEIEGATQYEMFWLITVPNIKPHLLTVAIFILIDTFTTSPISMYIDKLKQTQWGLRSAMSWLYVIVVIIILMVILAIAKIFKWGESTYEQQ